MKKFNKFLSVAVASAMVMAMAGCGNTDNGSAATGTNAATESAAASDSAASGSVFKIGGIGPTTGGAAVYGLAVQHGAEIAEMGIRDRYTEEPISPEADCLPLRQIQGSA